MKKKLVLVTIIMTLMILISVISNAADVKSLIFSSDKDEITRGESVQFTISSSELTGIEGTLKYDKNVWSVESKSSDYSFTINEETGFGIRCCRLFGGGRRFPVGWRGVGGLGRRQELERRHRAERRGRRGAHRVRRGRD